MIHIPKLTLHNSSTKTNVKDFSLTLLINHNNSKTRTHNNNDYLTVKEADKEYQLKPEDHKQKAGRTVSEHKHGLFDVHNLIRATPFGAEVGYTSHG